MDTKSRIKTNVVDPKILEQIKKELTAKKEQILEEMKGFSANDKHENDEHRATFPHYGDKPDDNAQEIDSYTTNIATEKVLDSTLRDIENALDRIEKGTYGVCKYCGKEIGEKRLLARPVASACVECKSKLQNGI